MPIDHDANHREEQKSGNGRKRLSELGTAFAQQSQFVDADYGDLTATGGDDPAIFKTGHGTNSSLSGGPGHIGDILAGEWNHRSQS